MAGTNISFPTTNNPAWITVPDPIPSSLIIPFAQFPSASANQGRFAIATDQNFLYLAYAGNWCPIVLLAAAAP